MQIGAFHLTFLEEGELMHSSSQFITYFLSKTNICRVFDWNARDTIQFHFSGIQMLINLTF